MPHKTREERAAYFREWKAGLRRRETNPPPQYIDKKAIDKAADRAIRMQPYLKEKARKQRELARQSMCAQLRAEIEKLQRMPFSWQREAK